MDGPSPGANEHRQGAREKGRERKGAKPLQQLTRFATRKQLFLTTCNNNNIFLNCENGEWFGRDERRSQKSTKKKKF